eukprot:jgi/Mesen1/8778/ME000524S08064
MEDATGLDHEEQRERPTCGLNYIPKLHLKESDYAKVVKGRIHTLAFLPTRDKVLVAAGDKEGQVGLWDVDAESNGPGGGDGVFAFQPHTRPVSGLAVPWQDCTKVYSASYDGTVRVLDVEAASFAEVLSDEARTFSALCVHPGSPWTLHLADDDGSMSTLDARAAPPSSSSPLRQQQQLHQLHARKVSTVQCHPQREWLVLTSSTDTAVSLWDVRRMTAGRDGMAVPYATRPGSRGVNSAYFSPGGDRIASTSYDNYVKIWDGLLDLSEEDDVPHKKKREMPSPRLIPHNNNTGRWVSSFRAVWAWDNKHVFIGSMARALDIFDTETLKLKHALTSEFQTTIPARLGVHPCLPIVAGGNASGKVFVWRQ